MTAQAFSIQIEDGSLFPGRTEILINSASLSQLGINISKEMKISLGSKTETAKVGISSAKQSIILIRKSLAQRLLLPFNATLHAWFSREEGKLVLGPVLGILISRADQDPENPFGSLTPFCREACTAAKMSNSLCYIATLESISVENGSAEGWTETSGEWRKFAFPLPHAFYNRLGSRVAERKNAVMQQLREQVPIFNDQFLNKWQVHEILSNSPISGYLPETRLCRKPQTIQAMLQRYPVLYLKPIHGSKGRDIIRIRFNDYEWIVEQVTVNGLHTVRYHSLKDLTGSLSQKLKKTTFVVQQGVLLLQQDGATVDFRALLQKNRLGEWSVTSLVARIGNPDSFVSNLSQGGKIERASLTLGRFRSSQQKIPGPNELKRVALEIAGTLEQHLPGNYGELGIDLGVDEQGKIWLIEVNSKPSKGENTIPANSQGPRPSVIRLFDYLYYLAGFPQQEESR